MRHRDQAVGLTTRVWILITIQIIPKASQGAHSCVTARGRVEVTALDLTPATVIQVSVGVSAGT